MQTVIYQTEGCYSLTLQNSDERSSLVLLACIHIVHKHKWRPSGNCKLRGLSPREKCTDRETERFSAKLVATFADRVVSRRQRGGSLTAVISVF
jgi:hypothetical protein